MARRWFALPFAVWTAPQVKVGRIPAASIATRPRVVFGWNSGQWVAREQAGRKDLEIDSGTSAGRHQEQVSRTRGVPHDNPVLPWVTGSAVDNWGDGDRVGASLGQHTDPLAHDAREMKPLDIGLNAVADADQIRERRWLRYARRVPALPKRAHVYIAAGEAPTCRGGQWRRVRSEWGQVKSHSRGGN